MKKNRLFLAVTVLALVFLASCAKKTATSEEYIDKITGFFDTKNGILNTKVYYGGREVIFISSFDSPEGNKVALAYYESLRKHFQNLKKEVSLVLPPNGCLDCELLRKTFLQQLDYYIQAMGKAIEAHKTNNSTLMSGEGADLLQNAEMLDGDINSRLYIILKKR